MHPTHYPTFATWITRFLGFLKHFHATRIDPSLILPNSSGLFSRYLCLINLPPPQPHRHIQPQNAHKRRWYMRKTLKQGIACIMTVGILVTQPSTIFALDATLSSTLSPESSPSAETADTYIPFDPTADDEPQTPIEPTQAINDIDTIQKPSTPSAPLQPIDAINDIDGLSAQILTRVQPDKLSKKSFQSKEKVRFNVKHGKFKNFNVRLFKKESKQDVPTLITKEDNKLDDGATVSITPPMTLVPGRYILQISDQRGIIQEEEFVWGVLAINTDKSMYAPNETVNFDLAVLDEKGEMVCDANLTLTIVNGNDTLILTSASNQITVTEQCSKKTFSLEPDYKASMKTGSVGTYALTLKAETKNGTYTITDAFEVEDNIPFDISRESATRIYPEHSYPMLSTITALDDFTGKITDVVPDFFTITPVPPEYPNVAQPDRIEIVSPTSNETVLGSSIVTLELPFVEKGETTPFLDAYYQSPTATLSAVAVLSAQDESQPSDSNDTTSPQSNNTPIQTEEPLLPSLGGYRVTQGFGFFHTEPSLMQYYKEYNLLGHDGIDIALPIGTPVTAVDDGKILRALENGEYGITVVVQHDWGRSYYGHLSKMYVKQGDTMVKGGIIGLSGNTGELTTGPHLHFGLKFNEADEQNGFRGKVDPAPYLGLTGNQVAIEANRRSEKVKVLTYDVSVKKGDTITIGYQYKTPPQSPRLYRVGPLRFFSTKTPSPQSNNPNTGLVFDSQSQLRLETTPASASAQQALLPASEESPQLLFTESRQWQIAVDGVYSGKHMRTVEYVLGNGSDNTARNDNTLVYAGTSWNTTKGSAGTKNVIIEGSGIEVLQAYVDASWMIIGAGDMTNIAMSIDVEGGPNPGVDVNVAEELSTLSYDSSNLSAWQRHIADVTPFFDRQSDTDFNAGLSVVLGLQLNTGAVQTNLATAKLVITYEQDYSTTAHTEVKTVRFPLDSTNGTDTGSRTSACAASSTCSFTYTATVPDATADANVLDVWFELTGEVNSASAGTFTPTINGGTTGPAFDWREVLTDNNSFLVYYRPPIGSPDFRRSTAQTLDIATGTVPIQVLGGEVVVTYSYSTGASSQTETLRYFMKQDTAANPGTGANNFSNSGVTISNIGFSVSDIWMKLQVPRTETNTLTVSGQVGASSVSSNAYTLGGSNSIRSGLNPIVIYNMSAQAAGFSAATTTIQGTTQWSSATGDAPIGAELYLTFTWTGSSNGTQTKTLLFGKNQQGVPNILSQYANTPMPVFLSERVNKTFRDAYVESTLLHSEATNIAANANTTFGVNGSTTTYNENQEEGTTTTEEAFTRTIFYQLSSSQFSGGTSIGWNRKVFEINQTLSQSDEIYYSYVFVATYDAALGDQATIPDPLGKQLKTVEFVLGNGTDTTARADNVFTYAGSSWNTTKGSAGVKTLTLEGTNIRVTQAFVEFHEMKSGADNINNIAITMDVESGPNPGTDVRIAQELSVRPYEDSGLTGFIRNVSDATALFTTQTDSEWSAGIDVVAGVAVDNQTAGSTNILKSLKLYITYESDFSALPSTETKTVRFPLDSTNGSDTGTRTAACAGSGTCSFSYNAAIPDATADADVLDVWFELSGEVDSNTASGITPQINGGSAGTAHNWVEAFTDDTNFLIYYRPAIGGSNFNRSTSQTLDIVNGSAAVNILGGELVVTYRYETNAPSQTETISYFMNQETSAPGTSKSTFSQSINLSQSSFSVSNLWYKVKTAPVAASTITVFGTVGAASEKSNGYTYAGVNPRAGNTPTIIYDMTADASSFSSSPTTVQGAIQWSSDAADTVSGVELYVTFTWSGAQTSSRTKTVKYAIPQPGAVDASNQFNNYTVYVTLPEGITKTHRSTYIQTSYLHSDSTSITVGTVNTQVNEDGTAVTETADTTSEAYTLWYYRPITNTMFSSGSTISWNERAFKVNNTRNQVDIGYYANIMMITYDVASENFGTIENPTLSQLMRHGKWFNSFGAEQHFTF